MTHFRQEVGRQVHRIEQLEECRLWVHARDDGRCGDFATGGDEAGHSLIANDDPFDLFAGPDLCSGSNRGCGHRLRQSPWAAAKLQSTLPAQTTVSVAQQHDQRAARRARSEHRAGHARTGDGRAQQFVLEPLAREVGDRHRQPSQQLMRAAIAECPEFTSCLQQLPQVPDTRAVDVWRGRGQHIAQQSGRIIDGLPICEIRLAISRPACA